MWNNFCVLHVQFRKKTKKGTCKILNTKAKVIKKMAIFKKQKGSYGF